MSYSTDIVWVKQSRRNIWGGETSVSIPFEFEQGQQEDCAKAGLYLVKRVFDEENLKRDHQVTYERRPWWCTLFKGGRNVR